MKQRIKEYFCRKKWVTKLLYMILSNQIVHSKTKLTKQYLKSKGFRYNPSTHRWSEPNINLDNTIFIQFAEAECYRVFYGRERVFIGLHQSQEWFDMYYFIMAERNRMYELAGV